MRKGFITLAQNNNDVDYVELSYYLALSLNNNKNKPISLITNEKVSDKVRNVFDNVIMINSDRSINSNWKLQNTVDFFELTPYDDTIFIEADMICLDNLDHWWNNLEKFDLKFSTNVKNYKGDIIKNTVPYRIEFLKNNIPDIYAGCFYFNNSTYTKEFFNTAKIIQENWDQIISNQMKKQKPLVFSSDVCFSLAAKMYGLDILYNGSPSFTHMKLLNQNWSLSGFSHNLDDDWRKCIDISIDCFNNSLGLKIGTIRQTGLFHYCIKDFLTDEMKKILELSNG